mmetsp:Transcript_37194/g.81751  ORF Transcript_37194/g.81751 Transcript_37194/m.81751 type:complete len:221 (-) Transcript_37194:67-729(-)
MGISSAARGCPALNSTSPLIAAYSPRGFTLFVGAGRTSYLTFPTHAIASSSPAVVGSLHTMSVPCGMPSVKTATELSNESDATAPSVAMEPSGAVGACPRSMWSPPTMPRTALLRYAAREFFGVKSDLACLASSSGLRASSVLSTLCATVFLRPSSVMGLPSCDRPISVAAVVAGLAEKAPVSAMKARTTRMGKKASVSRPSHSSTMLGETMSRITASQM